MVKKDSQDHYVSSETIVLTLNSILQNIRTRCDLGEHLIQSHIFYQPLCKHVSKCFWWSEGVLSGIACWLKLDHAGGHSYLLMYANKIVRIPGLETLDISHSQYQSPIWTPWLLLRDSEVCCKQRPWPWNNYFLKRHYQQWCEQSAQTALQCMNPWPGNGYESSMSVMSLA